MTDPMRASGVELALGPKLPAMLEAAGADVVTIHSSHSPGHGNGLAAGIVAITIERFRARSISNSTKSAAIDAALSALRDPNRKLYRTHPVDRPRAPDAPANSQLPLKNLSRSAATGRAFASNQNERLRTSRSRRSPGMTRSGQPTALLTAAPASPRSRRAE